MNRKYYPIILMCHQAALMKRRLTLPMKLLRTGLWKSESYYPEMPNHKSRTRIFFELLGHIMKYGSIEYHYFSYGFDVKGFRDRNGYLDDNWFLWKTNIHNTVFPKWDYTCILRDKALFSDFLSRWGFNSPQIIFDSSRSEPEPLKNQILTNGGGYFFKPIDGQCGGGIFKLVYSDGKCLLDGTERSIKEVIDSINDKFEKEHYIVQAIVEQHPVLNSIYDKSVNTLRLITTYDKNHDTVVPFSAVLRVGANGNTVDNWAKGGLAIGVDIESGKLKKYGYYKHGYGQKTMKHPNTHIIFDSIELPDYKMAIDNAKNLHYKLKSIPIIGWDIAFTPDGPLFIEGNDNMEISINQEVNGGLKKEFDRLFD